MIGNQDRYRKAWVPNKCEQSLSTSPIVRNSFDFTLKHIAKRVKLFEYHHYHHIFCFVETSMQRLTVIKKEKKEGEDL